MFDTAIQSYQQTFGHTAPLLPQSVHLILCVLYLSRGTMGDVLGALLTRNLHLTSGDAGPGYRSAQQVAVLIDGIGLDCRPDELFHKLCTQVFDEDLTEQTCAWC